MVNNQQAKLDLVFHALSDATRRSIMFQLSQKELSVTELSRSYQQTLAGISKHLKVLEQAELIKKTRNGRIITCTAELESIKPVYKVLDELGSFWRGRLEKLDALLSDNSFSSNSLNSNLKNKTNDNGNKR